MEKEIWKPIKGFEGLYEVSNLGNVKSLITSKILTPVTVSKGYLRVVLSKNNIQKKEYVHRLVLMTFKPREDMDLKNEGGKCIWCVDHINNKKTDNRLENLQWLLNSRNIKKETLRKEFKKNLYKALKEV